MRRGRASRLQPAHPGLRGHSLLAVYHDVHGLEDLRGIVRFAEEAPFDRKVEITDVSVPRRDEDLDTRPSVSYGYRELQPVHGSRHVDIGEQRIDLGMAFKQPDGVICITGVEDGEARVDQCFGDINTDKGLVLDNKDSDWRVMLHLKYSVRLIRFQVRSLNPAQHKLIRVHSNKLRVKFGGLGCLMAIEQMTG